MRFVSEMFSDLKTPCGNLILITKQVVIEFLPFKAILEMLYRYTFM